MQHIWTIFNKNTHLPVKEVQLKSVKGNISKISSLAYPFSLRNGHRNERKTYFLRRFITGNVIMFSSLKIYSEYLAQFFNDIIRVLLSLLQCKIPIDQIYLGTDYINKYESGFDIHTG